MSFSNFSLAPCFLHLAAILAMDAEDQELPTLTASFKECIKQHDFFYQGSDNISKHNKGMQELSIIERAMREQSYLRPLWEELCKEKGGKVV